MNREAGRATVHGITESDTTKWLTHTHTHRMYESKIIKDVNALYGIMYCKVSHISWEFIKY